MYKFPTYDGCEFCPDEHRERNGCGCSSGIPWTSTAVGDGFIGKGTYGARSPGRGGATVEPWRSTCPQWFARSPAVVELLSEIDDYEGGRMGQIDDMEYAHHIYLRLALAEREQWRAWWMDETAPEPRK